MAAPPPPAGCLCQPMRQPAPSCPVTANHLNHDQKVWGAGLRSENTHARRQAEASSHPALQIRSCTLWLAHRIEIEMHASAPLGEHAGPPPPTGCRRRRRRRRLPRLQVPPAPGRTQPMRLPQALWLLLGAQPLLRAPAPPAPQRWSAATGCGCRALETWRSGKSFCGAWHLCCRTCLALVIRCAVRLFWRLSWRCGWWSGTYVSTYAQAGKWRLSKREF